MKDAREPSEMPEFYDPELYADRYTSHTVVSRRSPTLTKEELEMVTKMATELSDNLNKGIIKW